MISQDIEIVSYRILDANFNRLGEALRVIEEFYRFCQNDESMSIQLKTLRHDLVDMLQNVDKKKLLDARSVENDCFANQNRPEELTRDNLGDMVNANFKRAQESSRVIEEYAKLLKNPLLSEQAKTIRFKLYSLEKVSLEF